MEKEQLKNKVAKMINQPDLLNNLATEFDFEFIELTEEEIAAIDISPELFGEEAESNLDGRGEDNE